MALGTASTPMTSSTTSEAGVSIELCERLVVEQISVASRGVFKGWRGTAVHALLSVDSGATS